ncbi:ABC transporter ATP-binding protein [Nitrococcus mobilis]|uniref:ABC transporter, ATPase subunit n=1 Tax=Nitrococcus mobilis Nb-231 TaxID=314278 RepID=A4BR77_9GAMM|nr:ABC transporter ATP-binding protein [Nitrococcus mobilis]EAR21699.1 ABC transporter, ATPase subunit [Nitrococcus mobilis Nb-231]
MAAPLAEVGRAASRRPCGAPLIEFRDLGKRYEFPQGRVVLDGLSGTIGAGEFLIIVGRSGSGKSTLLNLLGGLDRPSSGCVSVDGHSLSALSDRELTLLRRRRIGFIFQAYNLISTLTVSENLLLPLELNGLTGAADTVRRWLDRVGLVGLEEAYPDQLSGGEQQRVAVARALVHEPDLILADEPTGNLDLDHATRVVALLDELCRSSGKTLVMATHSREVAGKADRMLTIHEGRLLEVRE